MIIMQDPIKLLHHQINNLYMGGVSGKDKEILVTAYYVAMEKINLSFSHVKNKYYRDNDESVFNPLHVAQWTRFLYEMAHVIYYSHREAEGALDLCDKIYGISKMFSSADIFYGVKMPNIWFFDHPQGSVMGRAQYADYFTFSQGCTVGNNKGKFPVLGKHVSMLSNSKVLGNCNIGDHVIFAANTYVIDTDIPSYSIVFGASPDITIKPITLGKFNELIGTMFDGEDD